jgi:hypothetical protein
MHAPLARENDAAVICHDPGQIDGVIKSVSGFVRSSLFGYLCHHLDQRAQSLLWDIAG